MKKLLILAALLASIGTVKAAGMEGYSSHISGIQTNTTKKAFTNGPVYGKIYSINAVCSTDATFRVRTLPGKGSTLGSASKVILETNSLTSAGITTNVASTIYLYGDYIVTEVEQASTLNATFDGLIIVNTSP